LLSGFGAKVLTSENFLPWQVVAMNIAALGTAISFAKFIFLPHQHYPDKTQLKLGFWGAMVILLGGLVAANVFYYEAYTLKNIIKPLITIFLGWFAYLLIFKKSTIKFSRTIEEFDHLIGVMTLMLILLFWSVWTRSPILISF
jgi:multicomponent Na+:H+ antiporter subunit D